MVSLPEAGRDAVVAWLFAAPFVACGAALPSGELGVAARIAAAIVAALVAYQLLRSAIRRSYEMTGPSASTGATTLLTSAGR
jgi:hypothetical protein